MLLGARFVLARMASQFGTALLQGMLSVVGLVALMIPLKRKWITHIVGSLIYVWVVIQGMFNPGTPVLDFVVGLVIIGILTGVILYGGLLATTRVRPAEAGLYRATAFFSRRRTCSRIGVPVSLNSSRRRLTRYR